MHEQLYELMADAVLGLHAAIVLFVIVGPAAVVAGNRLGWPWVNGFGWRVAHLAAIVVVTAQAWLGIVCPLTTLENALRARAGAAGYETTFVASWLRRLLFYDAPVSVFAVAYTAFALLVAGVWWRFPPRRRPHRIDGGRAPTEEAVSKKE